MIRYRSALCLVAAAILVPACEPAGDPAPVALAGLGTLGAAVSGEEPWQGTVSRRIRWGPGLDALVAPFPDGERMAVTDWGTGDVAVYDIETGAMTHVTEQPAPYAEGIALFPAVSPDGKRIAYTWEGLQEYALEDQLRVVSVDGGTAERLYRGPAVPWIRATDWSPDGSRVLVNRSSEGRNEIATVSVADGTVTVLKTVGPRDVWNLRFSPDGRFVAYDYPTSEDTEDRDIHVLGADGSGESVLVEGPADDRLMGWAPDGRFLLFLSDRAGTPGAWLLPVSGGRAAGEPYLVKPDMWAAEALGFAADGRFFYAVGVGACAMYEVSLSADGRTLVTAPRDLSSRTYREVLYPRWSPDGRYIAFVVARQGRPPALRLRSSESGEERDIPLDLRVSFFRDLEWMPDGRSLLAIAGLEAPQLPVLAIDVRTGRTTTLARAELPAVINGITVSPDGRNLYYSVQQFPGAASEGRERITRRDLATGAEQTLLERSVDPPRRIRSLIVSPDGATLAFLDPVPGGSGGSRLHLLPVGGGTERAIGDEGLFTSLAWTPDGRALLLSRALPLRSVHPPARLERLDLATGEITALGLERDALGTFGRLSFHPDGRRAVFTAGAAESEWWVMEGFLGARESPGKGGGR